MSEKRRLKPYSKTRREYFLAALVTAAFAETRAARGKVPETPREAQRRRTKAREVLADLVLRGPELIPRMGPLQSVVMGTGRDAWSDADLDAYLSRLRAFFEKVVDLNALATGAKQSTPPPELEVSQLSFGFVPLPTAAGWKGGNLRLMLILDGSLDALLNYRLARLMAVAGLDRFKRCPRCADVFVICGRREFCSDGCQNVMRQRRLRAEAREATLKLGGSRGKTKRT